MYVGWFYLTFVMFLATSSLVLLGSINLIKRIIFVENDIFLLDEVLLFFNANYSNDILARVSLKTHCNLFSVFWVIF